MVFNFLLNGNWLNFAKMVFFRWQSFFTFGENLKVIQNELLAKVGMCFLIGLRHKVVGERFITWNCRFWLVFFLFLPKLFSIYEFEKLYRFSKWNFGKNVTSMSTQLTRKFLSKDSHKLCLNFNLPNCLNWKVRQQLFPTQ